MPTLSISFGTRPRSRSPFTTPGESGYFQSLGSRTLHLRLETGDVVTLRTGRLEDIGGITLCFELAQFDWTS